MQVTISEAKAHFTELLKAASRDSRRYPHGKPVTRIEGIEKGAVLPRIGESGKHLD